MRKPSTKVFVCLLQLLVVVGNNAAVAQQVQSDFSIHPAPVSCNAAYSAPCARTNSQYLALQTKQNLSDGASLRVLVDEIQARQHSMESGVYPFVFNSQTSICAAHGANPAWAGSSLQDIFDEAGIHFANVDELHARFVDAANRGGDWVQYLWTDISDNDDGNGGQINIHSKRAYVTALAEM